MWCWFSLMFKNLKFNEFLLMFESPKLNAYSKHNGNPENGPTLGSESS